MRRRMGIWGGLLSVLLVYASLCFWLGAVGLSADQYVREWKRLDVWPAAGAEEQDAEKIASALASVLRDGDPAVLQALRVRVFGVEQQAFHADEIAHMADVGQKFTLWAPVSVLAALTLLLLIIGWACLRKNPILRFGWVRGAQWGSWIAISLMVTLGVWAALDFHSIFVLFHQVIFTNDLWLLDPATDLLIRLMPLQFFIDLVLAIAWRWGGTVILYQGLLGIARVYARRRVEEGKTDA